MADQKTEWPDLVGKAGEQAKAAIQADRPDLREVAIVGENSPVTEDYREDRVRIFVKEDGTVAVPPRTG